MSAVLAEIGLVFVAETKRCIDSPEVREPFALALAVIAAGTLAAGVAAFMRADSDDRTAIALCAVGVLALVWALTLGPYDTCGPWTGFRGT